MNIKQQKQIKEFLIGEFGIENGNEIFNKQVYFYDALGNTIELPEGSTLLTLTDWNTFSDNLVITASGYTE